ncbi:MAG: replication protein [Candidatus Omnitrophica bacterium]|nr:replication protein [Candidatus Omnitrophota bacterium]
MDNNFLKFDPYTKVPNDLIETLLDYHFNSTEQRIILFIIRMTCGWNREKAPISYVSLSRRLKVDLRYIKRLIKRLRDGRVITIEKINQRNYLSLNRDYKAWDCGKLQKPKYI